MEKKCLFYEDSEKSRQRVLLFMILFYFGAFLNLVLLIFFLFIIPRSSLIHRDLDGISVYIIILCFCMAIYLNIYLKSKMKYSYHITIFEDEIKINIKGEVKTFYSIDLRNFIVIKKNPAFSEIELQFGENNRIFVITKKSKEFKKVLADIIYKNQSNEKQKSYS